MFSHGNPFSTKLIMVTSIGKIDVTVGAFQHCNKNRSVKLLEKVYNNSKNIYTWVDKTISVGYTYLNL